MKFKTTILQELNKTKLKFYQEFRSQELSEYYNRLICGDHKFVPEEFCPKINRNTPEFQKQLKRDHSIDNVVREIKLFQGKCKYFYLKVQKIDEYLLSKIENRDKDNSTKLLIKECYQRNCQSKEMKRRGIYDNKLDKLKKICEYEIKNENDHSLKIKSETTTGDKEKSQCETKDRNNRNSKYKYDYYQLGRYSQYTRWQYQSRQQRY